MFWQLQNCSVVLKDWFCFSYLEPISDIQILMTVVLCLVLFLIKGVWQPSCIILWVQHFSIKGGSAFLSELLGKHVASKLYGFLFDSLLKVQAGLSSDRGDIYFTVTLCESLTSVDKWRWVCGVFYLTSLYVGGKCWKTGLHEHGAASSMAIMTTLYLESSFRISLASVKRHDFKLLTSDIQIHH